MNKIVLLLLSFLLFFNDTNFLQCVNKKFYSGEEFLYEVSYGFMKIGQIRMKVTKIFEDKNGQQFIAKAYIDSYDWVPFVDLHQIMETYVNKNLYANHFKYYEKEGKNTKYTEYHINYEDNTINVKKGYVKGELLVDTTYKIKGKIQDGLSLYYFARANSGTKSTKNVDCFIIEKFGTATINFTQKKQHVVLESNNKSVQCNYLYGNANFIGIFGLTGEFNGWFSDDEYGIPIEASLKVLIGSVKVKLNNWDEKFWSPK
ncbi:MAG TPA: DUF3108 domain-containing protein [Ignavibacteriales bacterium]|nr:DUF3108 domain-containing protein [Ignavibacteriales bacterium]HOL80624.1 DUF3108 domain-containing protein [Ignavibacteriales bacterium]HOM64312.1 DUF3108 domain-containing protein [Ignavibacteriales bacterium]HPD68028.1 DUF3108 domain-containing protein [Ignavibacteriales bacterium]HPP33042.1 DUF3108 domain-containing protein [Ignavibacteriales bacterium]